MDLKRPNPIRVHLPYCPYEIWCRIFSHLDTTSPQKFTLTSRGFYAIASDPHARGLYFMEKYGKQLALYYAFRFHRTALTPEVGKLMMRRGAWLPRFLVQLVDKEVSLWHAFDLFAGQVVGWCERILKPLLILFPVLFCSTIDRSVENERYQFHCSCFSSMKDIEYMATLPISRMT